MNWSDVAGWLGVGLLVLAATFAGFLIKSLTPSRYGLGWIIGGSVVLAVLLWGLVPHRAPLGSSAYKQASVGNMRQIASAIQLFRQDHHGKLPPRLSQLIRDVGLAPRVFFVHSRFTNSIPVSVDNRSHDLVDALSPYRLFDPGDGRFVVFEVPGFWKDGSVRFICIDPNAPAYQNSRESAIRGDELVEKLRSGFR